MDIATPIGMVIGTLVVLVAIFLGGDFAVYINIPSIFIVIGGTIGSTIIRFTLNTVIGSLKTGLDTAFNMNKTDTKDLIEEALELTNIFRQKGPLGLEGVSVRNTMLQKGVQLIVDGFTEETIAKVMYGERDRRAERLEDGVKVFRAIGDAAPAFGMIGTLIGLVAMLANMDDPAAIGPSMAVALLTTLYGAMIAQIVALPMADKMESKIGVEYLQRTLVVDILLGITKGQNPDMLRDQLEVYLPPHQRQSANPDEMAA